MDRSSLLRRRLALPLASLASVGLLWFALPGRPAPPTHDLALRAAVGADCQAQATVVRPRLACEHTVAFAPDSPQVADVTPPAAAAPTRPVRPASYADGEPIDRELSWPDGNTPRLVPATPASAQPAPLAQTLLPVAQPVVPLAKAPEAALRPSSPVEATPRVLADPATAQRVLARSASRSRQLESIAQQADRHSRQGYELAGRKAYYAARREFTMALRLVAQGLDMERQSNVHARALAVALIAVGEADDFLPTRDRLDGDLNLADLVARHRTPVLKDAAENVAPMDAMKSYFTFAQEQLAVAVEHEVAGSVALHGLGKLHGALADQDGLRGGAAESKAMTFYQASLLADPKNFVASNDLGVLLARSGYYAEARTVLEHSLSACPQAAGWRNLAQVYRRLGDQDRAARAERLFQVAQREQAGARPGQTAVGRVDWIDPQAFAQSFAQTPSAREPLPARPAASKPEQPVAQKSFSNPFEKR